MRLTLWQKVVLRDRFGYGATLGIKDGTIAQIIPTPVMVGARIRLQDGREFHVWEECLEASMNLWQVFVQTPDGYLWACNAHKGTYGAKFLCGHCHKTPQVIAAVVRGQLLFLNRCPGCTFDLVVRSFEVRPEEWRPGDVFKSGIALLRSRGDMYELVKFANTEEVEFEPGQRLIGEMV